MDKTPIRKRQPKSKYLTESKESTILYSAEDTQDIMNSFSYSPNNDIQCVGWDPFKYKGNSSKLKPKRLLSGTPTQTPITLDKSPVCNIPRRKLNKGEIKKKGNFLDITSNLLELNERIQLGTSNSEPKTNENKCFPLIGIDTSSDSSNLSTTPEQNNLKNDKQEKSQEIKSTSTNLFESSSDSIFNDDADEFLIHCSQIVDPPLQTIQSLESNISISAINSPLRKVSKIKGINFSTEKLSSLSKSPKQINLKQFDNLKNRSPNTKSISTENDLANDSFDEVLTDVFSEDFILEEFTVDENAENINKEQNQNIHSRSSSHDPQQQLRRSYEKSTNQGSSKSETNKHLNRNITTHREDKNNQSNLNFKGVNRLPLPHYKSEIIKTNISGIKNNNTNSGPTNEIKNKLTFSNKEKEVMTMRCTPEEIEKKRQEAQRRLQQKNNMIKNNMKRNLTM